jgi:hypothetical protein
MSSLDYILNMYTSVIYIRDTNNPRYAHFSLHVYIYRYIQIEGSMNLIERWLHEPA